MPSDFSHVFSSGMEISPKWKTLAASAASLFPSMKVSRKCSLLPAPPEAITGMLSSSARRERAWLG